MASTTSTASTGSATGDNSVTVATEYITTTRHASANIANPLTEYYIIKLILNLLYSSSQTWRA
ncbi:hypothetical protein [Cyclobacterium marinum]|uniref:hypothetical protein n=1 Tax=Cyclobacterium marinum TaxID=104 RepID=UPI0012FCE7DB|nr:hypothetical protein [Cyclobacterium marinum]